MRILGLDLGITSIGWALIDIECDSQAVNEILDLGSRIVNLSADEIKSFMQPNGLTKNAIRRISRSLRRGYERKDQRNTTLQHKLFRLKMYDRTDTLNNLPPLTLWELRAKAATPDCQLSLKELGRVLLHLSKKRGYNHSRLDNAPESSNSDFVSGINSRSQQLKESGLTIGQAMYAKLLESQTNHPGSDKKIVTFRIKEGDNDSNLVSRKLHIDEFDRIMQQQQQYYPQILTPEVIKDLRNVIFFQRPLKSCKNLVNRDEMFSYRFTDNDGKEHNGNPRVAPRTSPISQLTRVWEIVNNIRLLNENNPKNTSIDPEDRLISADLRKSRREFVMTLEERRRVADYLFTHLKLNTTDLLKLLGLKRSDGFKVDAYTTKGIKGNEAYVALYNALEAEPNRDELLRFNPQVTEIADKETGEIHPVIDDQIINQPLYRLWHLIYSVPNEEDLKHALATQMGIHNEETLVALAKLDFTTPGFSSRSVKFMRRILPFLMQGQMYSEACESAGFRHSDYQTKEENDTRKLETHIPRLTNGSLRQPIVEKILNQMINLVNDIIATYGPIDEIRVELARELKQSKEQRIKTQLDINSRERENEKIKPLIEQYGLKATRRRIQKYWLWEETNKQCIYCGAPISASMFLSGEESEVEHIIPRSLLFDDSMSNKTCSCAICNKAKGQTTAYDFMLSKGEEEFTNFKRRVEELAERKDKYRISRTKLKRFLTPAEEIPTDFIERDLQLTRYISKMAMEILKPVTRNVYASSGKLTDFFRNAWGYNRILEELNIPRYEKADLVDYSGSHPRINGWNKRLDHRHHAIDALVVALTRQGYVQKLNTLNASRDEMRHETNFNGAKSESLLERWAAQRAHFSTSEVKKKLSETAVSFKNGKKSTTPRTLASDQHINIPRGALHEETIYGAIYIPDGLKPVDKCLDNPDIIASPSYRQKIIEILSLNNDDIKLTKAHLKKNPLLSGKGEPITQIPVRKKEYVKRATVESLKANQIDKIVDEAVKAVVKQRFEECGSEKAFQQSVVSNPLRLSADSPITIKRVTLATGLNEASMVAVRHHNGHPTAYAKTGNNHHVAFYKTTSGEIIEMITPLWIAVKRRNLGLPAVISNPAEAWLKIEQMDDSIDIQAVADTLPPNDSTFLYSLAINDMVVIGLSDDEWNDALRSNDMAVITDRLYRVQKLSSKNYWFRFHTVTSSNEDSSSREMKNFVQIQSLKVLQDSNIRKVNIDCLGHISPNGL